MTGPDLVASACLNAILPYVAIMLVEFQAKFINQISNSMDWFDWFQDIW